MSSVELGYGLAVLAQELREGTDQLRTHNPTLQDARQHEANFEEAACLAGGSLAIRRVLIARYAAIIVAKEHPKLEATDDDNHSLDFPHDGQYDLPSITERIEALCDHLVQSSGVPAKTLRELEEALVIHMRLTEQLYHLFVQKARICSEMS